MSLLIGVIDLLGGKAVHAVAGKRDQYRSVIADGVECGSAMQLAARYARFGVTSLYVADLDAILGRAPNLAVLQNLIDVCDDIWIDAGAGAIELERALQRHAATSARSRRFILPTENFASPDQWASHYQSLAMPNGVLGLDLNGPRVRFNTALHESPSDDLVTNVAPWLDRAVAEGVTHVVVLDLAHVGISSGGGTMDACQKLALHWPSLTLISGGGVRNAADIAAFVNAGCRHVLVATALHRDEPAAGFLSLQ